MITISILVHRSEVLTNLSRPLLSLRQLVEGGELVALLARPPRSDRGVPGRQRRLDAGSIDQLVRDYASGLSVYALAERHGIDRGVVAAHLKDRGVPVRPTLLQSEIDRALELHAAGDAPNKIGKLLGRDPKTIRTVLRRYGFRA